MTQQLPPPSPRMAKIQSELIDLSARLNVLARDFEQLAAELPQQVPTAATQQPAAPVPPAAAYAAPPVYAQQAAYPPPPPQVPPMRQAPPMPQQSPAPMQRMAPPAPPRSTPYRAPAPTARPVKPRRQISIAEIFSIVGSAITLLGVSFVLLLPTQAVLPDLVRAAIGLGLAAVAVAVALVQHRREPSNIGSQALMATGVASAFLTVLALSSLFRGANGEPVVPQLLGMVFGGLISLGGVAVARWWRSQWLAVLAVLGSLILAPYLGGRDALAPMVFMLVMTLVTATFQHKVDWVVLLMARVLPTSLYFMWVAAAGVGMVNPQVGLALAFVLAAGGLGIATLHQGGSDSIKTASVVALITMSAPLTLAMWAPDRWLSVGLVGAFGVIMVATGLLRRVFSDLVRSAAVPMGALFVVLAVVRVTDGRNLGYVFFTLAAAYFAVAAKTKFRPVLVVAGVLAAIGVLVWLPTLVRAFAPLPGAELEHTAQSVLGLVATLLGVRALRAFREWGHGLTYAAWVTAVVFGSLAAITGGTLIAQRTGGDIAQGFQTAHALVTVAWLLLSVWLLRRGLRKEPDSAAAVRLAIALAAAAVAKLFFFDLSRLPDLVRALAFLAVGVLMLVIGTWYHKQLERVRKAGEVAEGSAVGADVAASAAPAVLQDAESQPDDQQPPTAPPAPPTAGQV